ncbi:Cytochrome c family protein [Methylomonas albis]|uniref:C-type cytochrome n=1 Tax=Methylomonas albis TaxID=1854563 RepID=A0ABR9CWS9_9GAMM|nr:cytochrome c [Methylomonas albis]MBD9355165.1 c-type cytochrome [Methylomonas albis]CAD6878105.1 Cytochrome c family protein [Methylomonas albis]
MDFPIFHIDFIGNRLLIAIDAILHVIINHAFAIGALPVVALFEFKGMQTGNRQWDDLAYRLLKIIFILTTTVGALTGVGIWFSAALVNPAAIGSLIRVFFWGWFVEWLVFVTEVSLIMVYFLSWQQAAKCVDAKRKHLRFGVFLATFSWITMAIIVAILGFMMDPGSWLSDRSLLSGLFNPMYLPQLAFRTALAMVMGSMVVLFLLCLFSRGETSVRDVEFKRDAVSLLSRWSAVWVLLLIFASVWYYNVVPGHMLESLPVAIATQDYVSWHSSLKWLLIIGLIFVGLTIRASFKCPGEVSMKRYAFSVLLLFAMLGQFERVREFIRKPFIIGQYMYANGIRVEEYPLLQRDGLLQHAIYAGIREVTPDNTLHAGREVFAQACTRCHTVKGVNGIRAQLQRMYGDKPWDAKIITAYLENMHNARYFMPPFPGNNEELKALSAYLASLQKNAEPFHGAQVSGIPKPDSVATSTSYGFLPDLSKVLTGVNE